MDELVWLSGTDVRGMLRFLNFSGRASDRKYRLLACACCRHAWDQLPDPRSRRAVEVIERYLDGMASERERTAAQTTARDAWPPTAARIHEGNEGRAYYDAADIHVPPLAEHAVDLAARGGVWADGAAALGADAVGQSLGALLLRDLFGNPFRSVTLDPAWITPAILRIAQAAYTERELPSGQLDQARLNVLADALEEAGCTVAEVLTHLRGPRPHARGCHVLDAILAKE